MNWSRLALLLGVGLICVSARILIYERYQQPKQCVPTPHESHTSWSRHVRQA